MTRPRQRPLRPTDAPARLPVRARVAAVAAVLLAAVVPALSSPVQAASVGDVTAGRAAAGWLADRTPDGILSTGGVPDWGLTADTVFTYASAGLGPTAGRRAADVVAANATEFVSPLGGSNRVAGALAKLLVVAVVQGDDPSTFGGYDLRAELLATMSTTAPDLGRFRNAGGGDTSNGFTQSLAVIGLARTGGVPSAAVDHLLAQQCPSGGFRLFLVGGGGCTVDTAADPDATAVAVQALALVPGDAAAQAATRGLDFLAGRQNADGSFGGAGPTAAANANTTGLVAMALRGAGRSVAADRATTWLRGLQIGCADGASAPDLGAVAYNPTLRAQAVSGGAIAAGYVDQFRRTTSEAVLGMGGAAYGTLSATAVVDAPARFDCSVPGTTTTAPSPTSSTTSSTPGATTTTAVTTTTNPSVTSTTAGSSTTTTTTSSRSATTSTAPPAVVGGISTSRSSGSGGSTSTSRSTGSSLATTGTDPGRSVAWAAIFGAVGIGMVAVARERRRPRPTA